MSDYICNIKKTMGYIDEQVGKLEEVLISTLNENAGLKTELFHVREQLRREQEQHAHA